MNELVFAVFLVFLSLQVIGAQIFIGDSGTQCGMSHAAQPRIVNGDVAVPHNFPFIANIRYKNDTFSNILEHSCGASILNEYTIITAKHCIPYKPITDPPGLFDHKEEEFFRKMQIFVGDHSLSLYDEGEVTISPINIDMVISHEEADVALIRLPIKIPFSNSIAPICLPSRPPSDYENLTLIGWGTDTFDPEVYFRLDLLHQATLPVVPKAVCNQPSWLNNTIGQNDFCAGYEEGLKDACSGDSGGPLFGVENDRYVLRGIVSGGNGCGSPKAPGVYADVFSVLPWILKNMKR